MLFIRPEQMAVFEAHSAAQLELRLIARAQQEWPERAARFSIDELRSCIHEGIARARVGGLSSDYDVSCFVDLMFVFSRDFDSSPGTPWAAEILGNSDMPAWLKRDRLLDRARNQLLYGE
jgi:hypothetical protein